MLQLYSYFQSTCSWRVRIALHLKGLEYEYKAVKYGDQLKPEFLKLNPMGFVPILVDGDMVLADSMAITLYLDDKFPHVPLLPQDPKKRALNFQAASIVYSNIQPYQNAITQKDFQGKISPDEKVQWIQYHVGKGLGALEKLLEGYAGKYATGDEVFLADLFLAPQIYAAIHRFHLDMLNFPTLMKLNEEYGKIPAFQDAMPDKQPDAVKR